MSTLCKTGLSSILLLAGLVWVQPAVAGNERTLYEDLMAAKTQLTAVTTEVDWTERAIQEEVANVTRLDAEFRGGGDPVAIGRELELVAARVDIIEERTVGAFNDVKSLRVTLFKIKTEAYELKTRWIYGQAVLMLQQLDSLEARTNMAWQNVGRLHDAIQRLRDDMGRR